MRISAVNVVVIFVFVVFLISSGGVGSGEIWHLMWHVVSRRHHVHPVSYVCWHSVHTVSLFFSPSM